MATNTDLPAPGLPAAAAKSAGEATWLAYVVYGNPCATLTTD